ncbi:MAG: hypothetical protein ABI467_30765 [Kofleriaceae bacterium]
MGLAISTHFLADMLAHDAESAAWIRESIEVVNALLEDHGLPAHEEPTIVTSRMRPHCSSFPYSFRQDQALTSVGADEDRAPTPRSTRPARCSTRTCSVTPMPRATTSPSTSAT